MTEERILEMFSSEKLKNSKTFCHDYIDGLLSLKHKPNIVTIGMTHIAANHANNLLKEDNRKYGKAAKRGKLFFSYESCVALSDDPESIRLSTDIRMDNDIKYQISFTKSCCNILWKTQRKISFKLIFAKPIRCIAVVIMPSCMLPPYFVIKIYSLVRYPRKISVLTLL